MAAFQAVSKQTTELSIDKTIALIKIEHSAWEKLYNVLKRSKMLNLDVHSTVIASALCVRQRLGC